MKGSFSIGRVLGVDIRIHWTFFLLAAWFAWWGREGEGWQASFWALALLAGLFGCVILHELGHSLVAIRFGAQVQAITLLPIGGVALMKKIPERSLHEFLVAIAGPSVNVALFLGLALLRGGFPSWSEITSLSHGWAAWLDTIMRANVVMAVFNLVPAFPMDGGRVLRSVLGWRMPRERATHWAVLIGQVLAVGFMVLGFYVSPVLALIGVFVFLGAGREEQITRVRAALQDVRIRDAMMVETVVLHPDEPLSRCLDLAVHRKQEDFAVEANGRLVGILARADWVAALQARGEATPVGEVARRHFLALHPDAPLTRVYEELGRMQQPLFPVIENGQLVGLLTVADAERFLALREVRFRPLRPRTDRARFTVDLG
ncbi:MAG: site-2 protease family protein [Verrucomicrobia bacterium]|nr:site-2 protease family protein [Verrucomicrobiota bacterium]